MNDNCVQFSVTSVYASFYYIVFILNLWSLVFNFFGVGSVKSLASPCKQFKGHKTWLNRVWMEETAFSCLLSHCVGMWPGDPTAACSTETSAATYEEEERAGGKEQPLPAAAQLGRLQKVCISFFFFKNWISIYCLVLHPRNSYNRLM